MPVKVILMLKRKPGMSPEEFRQRYETGHSRLGLRLFGHLWKEYRRNYLGPANSFAAATNIPAGGATADARFPYDVVTELVFHDMAAFAESNRIASEPENRRLITEDEETLFDRPNCWGMTCETLDEDPVKGGIAAGNVPLKAKARA